LAFPKRSGVARSLFSAIGLALVLWLLPGRAPVTPVERYHLSMGTLVKLVLYVGEDAANPASQSAVTELAVIDSLMSSYSATSETSLIGADAGEAVFVASAAVAEVIERSIYFSRLTRGAFDPTVGALTQLWNFPDAVMPPGQASIDSALTHVDYDELELNGNRVFLRRHGMQLDLGAAVKGFAVDRAVAALEQVGVDAGLVEAGGDLRFWGRKPDGEPWLFGVRHPRIPDCTVISSDVGLSSVATSGDYEQTFEFEQVKYHHILDPATGRPARSTVSATAWATTALDADILSTALFVLGPKEGIKLVEGLDEVEALMFYDNAGHLEYVYSAGLSGSLQFPDCARN
jgi:thiamine biosynthesis lipoprotein